MLTNDGRPMYYVPRRIDGVGHVWLVSGKPFDTLTEQCACVFANAIAGNREAFEQDLAILAQWGERRPSEGE